MINKEILIKKIIYRSTHRGTKEMDLLLGKFVKSNISKLSISELNDLLNLLEAEDKILEKWIFNKTEKETIPLNRVSKMLKNFKI